MRKAFQTSGEQDAFAAGARPQRGQEPEFEKSSALNRAVKGKNLIDLFGEKGESARPMSNESQPNFHVVLFQPEIPTNTGNIGRVCVASGCHLHLIGPMGFSIDEKQVRRAGLDYWVHLNHSFYETYEDFLKTHDVLDHMSFMTTKTDQTLYDKSFNKGDWLMFGPETRGLPDEVWRPRVDQAYKIPMVGPTRSLNLANSVSITTFEGLRQLNLS